ncbi:putative uncharacterized protein DDB_G0268364 [Eupeodes corollae]|uniref:putative uncharacterized protein DDB_G0268364 n=1 Tax=Eupeodes corollae TaxID=290404 RepID=UPI002491F453|nr:putative uncharacterized protein DDB_G0268364 [Eupeodes corollae]
MKQWIFVINTLLLISLVSGALKSLDKDTEKLLEKSPEKIYPKKVTSLKKKPTKSPIIKSPIESFKDLPVDDLEFIKELDKQFKLHGDKIKIKVERDNSTAKNSKRTVEGDLGYGYYNGQESGGSGYEYPKPTFRFYPYSQHDIPASAPGYHIKEEEQSTISIIPSYSYELKQNGNGGYDTKAPFVGSQADLGPHDYHQQEDVQANGHGQEQAIGQIQGGDQGHGYHQYNEPVIVLRIPGPTKYATHLQSLLQQYLEIRAAQYLKILEEAEHQKQQQQQQQHQQQQEQQYHSYEQVQEQPQEVHYEQQPQQHQQPAPAVEQPNYGYAEQHYPAIDDVYQSFKGRQQETHQVVEQQYATEEAHGEQPQQYYYMPVDPGHQSAHAPGAGQAYQTMYFYAMETPDYGHQNVYVVPQGYDDTPLPITENNPRSTHTKVHFSELDNRDHSTQYPLPSIKPFERHAPPPTAIPIHENYQTEDGQTDADDYQQQQTDQQYYQHQPSPSSTPSQVVSITQRPFNYHAHSVRSKNSKRNSSPTGSPVHSRRRTHAQITRQKNSDSNISKRTKKEAA